jgi:hypothetical protein
MGFPTRIDDLTESWIGDQVGADVQMDIRPMSDGPGYVSDMCFLELTSSQAHVPSRLVVKVNPSFEASNDFAQRYQIFEREALFYKEVAPQTPIRTPKAYFADFDPDTKRGIVVLEDCSHYELRSAVADVPATRAEALAVGSTAGRLHGRWWGRGAEGVFPWAMAPGTDLWRTFFGECAAHWLDFNRSPFVEGLSPEAKNLAKRLESEFASKVMAGYPNDRLTLCHLDMHIDNMFFDPTSDDPIILFDWQGAHWGRGAFDLSYFLGYVFESSDRASIESDVLDHYLDTLRGAGVDDYSKDELWRDYRFGLLFGLWVLPLAVANLDLSSEHGQDIMRKVTRRKFAAVMDHDGKAILDSM